MSGCEGFRVLGFEGFRVLGVRPLLAAGSGFKSLGVHRLVQASDRLWWSPAWRFGALGV